MTYEPRNGPTQAPVRSSSGPYDIRLGYASLSDFSVKLQEKGYFISRQVRASKTMREWTEKGFFPIYHEKTQAGLNIADRAGRTIYSVSYPLRIFSSFSEVPPVIVDMLLFIEDRTLLEPGRPFQNPAIDWGRLVKAILDQGIELLDPKHPAAGGSTLATQLEKFRHSPGGRTASATEKLRQIVSASFRAYQNGRNTLAARQQIVVDYLNSVPLAAFPGYGEILGLGEGLWAWYGVELDRVIDLLKLQDPKALVLQEEKALRLRQVLSLLLAHRKPTYYLGKGREVLSSRCNAYLRLLSEGGIISAGLKDRAFGIPLALRSEPIALKQMSLQERKSANPVRIKLLSLLGMGRLYELDRLDLSVKSTLDMVAQHRVTDILLKLNDPRWVAEKGLNAPRLLENGAPEKVIYAFTMYEKTPAGHQLRIQTSNSRQALNINEGVKLDLGSTAKLRTLIHYLEIIASLYDRYSDLNKKKLLSINVAPEDKIRRWAISYFLSHDRTSLVEMLWAAMEREYSANPAENFFTGGGMHTFHNFDEKDDHAIMSVRDGFLHSVNLVFIRLMRDVVRYHMYGRPGFENGIAALHDPVKREEYLIKFADFEGSKFLGKFFRRYRGKSEEEAFAVLLQSIRPRPHRLAVLYRFIYPQEDLVSFGEFLRDNLPGSELDQGTVAGFYRKYSPESLSLNDAGYIARVHPLELWLVSYLRRHPHATWDEILDQSTALRKEAYQWLFRTSRRHAQDKRIRIMLEMEAFVDIHSAWKRLGYPFDTLVPSYATSIGTSADRPGSLAELMGILLNEGLQIPSRLIGEMCFAPGTPYETHFVHEPLSSQSVLRPEIVKIIRGAMLDVVRSGTARRLARLSLKEGETSMALGGKTGTGDHRYEIYGRGGRLIASRVMNRTATFAFILGDRYFGVITAYVSGPEASDYNFTSSLPLAVLELILPAVVDGTDSG
jgi:membrane peptidoglycan carboxypeptidase